MIHLTKWISCLAWAICIMCSLNSGCKHKPTDNTLYIATAANMQYAMKEIAAAFTTASDIPTELIIGSSGKLTVQIMEGAPYHIFISANRKYPEELKKAKLVNNDPLVFASGQLILWTMDKEVIPSIEVLSEGNIDHVALANPITAPYGIAANEVLQHYNLENQIKDKLVYGESISQTNQFIHSQSANIGFTSLSTIHAPNLIGQGQYILLPPQTYEAIEQTVVALNNDQGNKEMAVAFANFLSQTPAQDILRKYGYHVN